MAQNSSTSSRQRALRYAAPVLAGMLLLGACGKKDEPAAPSQSGGGQASSSGGGGATGTTKAGGGTTSDTSKTTGTATKGTSVANASINQTVWYLGFKLTLGSASYDKEKATWSIDTDVENLGDGNDSFGGPDLTLVEGSNQVAVGRVSESPSISAKGKAQTKIEFNAKDEVMAKLAKLTLVMGNGTKQQVKVPLDGSTATTLKPVPQDGIKGDFVVGNVTLTPTKSEVRYDDPDQHTQAAKGKVFLMITGKAKNADLNTTYYFDGGKVALTVPDGTKETPTQFVANPSGNIDPVKTIDFKLDFTIPDPFAGDYSLTLTPDWGPESAPATGTVKFTLAAASAGTTSGSTPGTTAKK